MGSLPIFPRRLDELPDEILIQILENVSAQHDLSATCLVNRRMNHVADPVLYKSILFCEPKHHFNFSESLVKRPRRGSVIQDIRLEYPSSELSDFIFAKESRIDGFSHTISTMSNLESLEISVPESLCHGIGTLFNGPFDLACLKTCSLFYQREDGGYWDLKENIHIFCHPTLESLTITRAKLDEKGFESIEQPSETALAKLRLIECDINDEALSELLLFPDCLKEITINHTEEPSPPLEESADATMHDYILALSSAQETLEYISINFPTLGGHKALRLRKFVELKELHLRDYQLFGKSSSSPRMHSVGLPPELEILKLWNPIGGDEGVAELLCYEIENLGVMARNLKKFIIEGEGKVPEKILDVIQASKEPFELEFR
ncbi:hypothetical protein K504DRAFT_478920 [Pleomassaria siparia CBS 279.74]|uniref:F-box domain-containing protein n=1 Tax=Pleomassaria siparia CBS 279.74 TaxID=1314801 RepID=A0A6G1KJI9_9PLEO|nr:hypothetical protein K504DRAFT_478920 [Pleomassaria siparia CBS 279.74]